MKLHKLFEEIFDEINKEYVDVFNEGKKIFPKLKLDYTTISGGNKLHLRFFTNYPKNKGSFGLNSFKKYLIDEKINKVKKWLLSKGIEIEVSKSRTISGHLSGSFYFKNKENKEIRISNHQPKTHDLRPNLIINWDTQPDIIKNFMVVNNVI